MRLAHVVDPETGCWRWTAALTSRGYGETWDGATVVLAHRASYEKHKGAISDGLCLDHLCRNRACINPDHLEPVTVAENNRRGKNVKLNWEKVCAIRARADEPNWSLALEFGVARPTISNILSRRIWREAS